MLVNIGSIDRLVRVLAGAVLIALALFSGAAFFGTPLVFWSAIGIGVVLILTGTLRFCPLYRLIGLSTSKDLPND